MARRRGLLGEQLLPPGCSSTLRRSRRSAKPRAVSSAAALDKLSPSLCWNNVIIALISVAVVLAFALPLHNAIIGVLNIAAVVVSTVKNILRNDYHLQPSALILGCSGLL